MRYTILALVIFAALGGETALAAVNINSASYDELDALPGVGEVTINKILNYRTSNGAFVELSQVCALVGTNGVSVETATCQNIGAAIYFGALGETVPTENSNDNEEGVTTTSSAGGDKKIVRAPVSSLSVKIPNTVYVGQVVDFAVEPTEGTNDRLVRYSWNFGDGATSDQREASHQYRRPGNYLVIAESYFQKQFKTARKEIIVLPLAIKLTSHGSGVEVKNEGKHELDLSGMSLSGSIDFVFAKHTILLPGASLMVEGVGGLAVMKDEHGLALSTSVASPVPVRSVAPKIAAKPKGEVLATSTSIEISSAEKDVPANLNVAAAGAAPIPENAWPYLGLLAIMSFGFIALFTSRSV